MDALSVQKYFERDHDRLDELFRRFQGLKDYDYLKAKERFREFKTGLQRHIIWEEEILFPLFEAKTGVSGYGPTEVMRQEHRQIKHLLETIRSKVQMVNVESEKEELELVEVLGQHNWKEEKILYPAIDQALSDEDRREVFARMERVPREAYDYCCEGRVEASGAVAKGK